MIPQSYPGSAVTMNHPVWYYQSGFRTCKEQKPSLADLNIRQLTGGLWMLTEMMGLGNGQEPKES